MNEELFQKNFQLWVEANPKMALLLQFVQNSKLKLLPSKNGMPNLVRGEIPLLDSDDPAREAAEWLEELDLSPVSVLYIYGIGLGYYYDALLKWLSGEINRRVVFLEDDPEVIRSFFYTERATTLLKDPKASLILFKDLKDDCFEELYWDFILTQMAVSALRSYRESKPQRFMELKQKITHDAAIKNALVEEYLHCGLPYFRNFYPNMLCLSESFRGTNLYNKFEGIPAIICGAGPSLEKNIDTLRGYLDKAILFGGGSALNALSSRGILPHFGVGVDPNPTQQYRLSSNKAYEVPLFYRNRLHVDAFRLIHGPKLYIPGAGGYEVADWFDEEFGLTDDIEWLDEGHNVVNFALEIANRLGCNPILFVGVDLAYTEMQSYASGIVDDTAIKESEILNTGDFDSSALLKNDIYGKPIYTLWKWIAESEWISDYAKKHPNLRLINCTEGGLGMEGIPNSGLKEAAESLLTRSYDLCSLVQGEILNSEMPEIDDLTLLVKMEELNESLKRSINHIEVLIEDKEIYERRIAAERHLPEIKQTGLAALAETELEEEPAYIHIIGVFNLIYSRILNRELLLLQREECELSEWEKEVEVNRINRKRLQFMLDVAKVNSELIAKSLEERKEQLRG